MKKINWITGSIAVLSVLISGVSYSDTSTAQCAMGASGLGTYYTCQDEKWVKATTKDSSSTKTNSSCSLTLKDTGTVYFNSSNSTLCFINETGIIPVLLSYAKDGKTITGKRIYFNHEFSRMP